jgi:hydrogenase expression/formation protein HypE
MTDFSCPVPKTSGSTITMAHGGGGGRTRQLLESIFLPGFSNPALEQGHDGAYLEVDGIRLAFTTDSHVVQPLFFPGGDIGALAVYGTVNDLAMCGARPLGLSAGFILEEGLPLETLEKVVASMQAAAREAGVDIITGDTKVIDKGQGGSKGGMFINTTGVGRVLTKTDWQPAQVAEGDAVILSGPIGRHGMAIMAQREGLAFESAITSDLAPLFPMVESLIEKEFDLHCLRDCTRGGVATALIEIAEGAGKTIEVDEDAFPIPDDVRGACEILGLDPLYVANEGCLVAFLPEAQAEAALQQIRSFPQGGHACLIGQVAGDKGKVLLKNTLGSTRILDLLSGEQLPRIC